MSATDQPKSVVSVPREAIEPVVYGDERDALLAIIRERYPDATALPECPPEDMVKGGGPDRKNDEGLEREILNFRALAAVPLPQGEGLGWRNLGWFAGLARKHGHHVQADWLEALAQPAPAPQVDLGSNRKGDLPTEQAAGGCSSNEGAGKRSLPQKPSPRSSSSCLGWPAPVSCSTGSSMEPLTSEMPEKKENACDGQMAGGRGGSRSLVHGNQCKLGRYDRSECTQSPNSIKKGGVDDRP